MVVESHLRLAAKRAGVIEIRDGKTYINGEFLDAIWVPHFQALAD